MNFIKTSISDALIVESSVFEDFGNVFMGDYHFQCYTEAGISNEFVQYNQPFSTIGTLRGLHCQVAHTHGKLVRVQ